MVKKRIFIAINLSEQLKRKLFEWELKLEQKYGLGEFRSKNINWVIKNNLHITLIFIGYVTDDETYKICKTVKDVAKNHSQFYIELERIVVGPPHKQARMFWVEGGKSRELANLQTDLENALSGASNYKKEVRPFSPHITLARFTNQVARILPEINELFKSPISVDSIDVMQSILHSNGPEYTILERVELEGNENEQKNKKLLIVSSGGLRGAYGAGVLVGLYRGLGADYFDDILACSAGSCSSTYYLSGQIKEMEYVWRNLLDSKKFFSVTKKLQKKQILDLDYLYKLMTKNDLKLNIDKIFKSRTDLKYTLTEYRTGKTVYLKPQKKNILQLIKGSAALFPLYQPVKIGNKEYIDGAFGEPTPFKKEFIKEYDKILIIQNSNYSEIKNEKIKKIFGALTVLTPPQIDKIINHYLKNIKDIETAIKHKNVFLLTPSKTIPLKSRFDTNKRRINATFDLGIKDAKKAIKFLKNEN